MSTIKTKEYFVTRYSLIPDKQITLDAYLENISKEETFKNLLDSFKTKHCQECIVSGKKYVFYCKCIAQNRYAMSFGKHTNQIVGEITESDIVDKEIDNYKKCAIFIDITEQIMIIQRNSEIGNTMTVQKNTIAKAISELLKTKALLVEIGLFTEKSNFWKYIIENEGNLKSLEVQLTSPNFLKGITSVNELLSSFNDEYNNTSLKVNLQNSDGKLTIPKNNAFLDDVVKYAASGCGNWKIGSTTSSKPYSSEDAVIVEYLPATVMYLTQEDINAIDYAFKHIKSIDTNNRQD